MTLTGGQLLLYIALAAFIAAIIVIAIDFALDGVLSLDGRNTFILLLVVAVIVVIVAVILGKVAA